MQEKALACIYCELLGQWHFSLLGQDIQVDCGLSSARVQALLKLVFLLPPLRDGGMPPVLFAKAGQ